MSELSDDIKERIAIEVQDEDPETAQAKFDERVRILERAAAFSDQQTGGE